MQLLLKCSLTSFGCVTEARKRKREERRLRRKDGKLVADITNQKDLQEISPFDDECSFVVMLSGTDFWTVPLM